MVSWHFPILKAHSTCPLFTRHAWKQWSLDLPKCFFCWCCWHLAGTKRVVLFWEDVENGGQENHLRHDVLLAVGMLYYFNGFLNEGVQLCMGCKYVSSPCFSLARFLVYDLLEVSVKRELTVTHKTRTFSTLFISYKMHLLDSSFI